MSSSVGVAGHPAAKRQARGRTGTEPGRAHPLGAWPDAGGVNFAIYAREATAVSLLLFSGPRSARPDTVIELDPNRNRTFGTWHVYVPGLGPGACYGFRVDGPRDLSGRGLRFDPDKVLVDPYSLGLTAEVWNRDLASRPGDNAATCMRSVVVDLGHYDWEGDRPLGRPLADSVIYELHVGGFTRSPSSGVARPGTFAGVIEKIPYLRDLGITAVELLPVFAFDEHELDNVGQSGTRLTNYWGYSPLGFFAPHHGYCVRVAEGAHINEFRDLVKALHRAGIEVILDVVFNHTGEGGERGPTISFKGLGNNLYYFLDPADPSRYLDYSGCGNTLDCNHPVVEKFVVDCLEHWVREMHVDGFRFDEGSILSRGLDGQPLDYPPVLWQIELSEVLADTKIIAEAWDAAGLYQVGSFPGQRWATWNGVFRDQVRRFVRGDRGLVADVASRLGGSADLYQDGGRLPTNGVNFLACHDGFSLNDLVSYNEKHNLDNGEGNRDGIDQNHSWNCGVEGPTEDPMVELLRERQIKNLASILLLSQGVPMLLAGDEVRRTQRGNNNAYCQDNEVSWFDWGLVERNAGMLRFFRHLIALRRSRPELRRSTFYTGLKTGAGRPDITWHGCRLGQPGFGDPASGVLACTIAGGSGTDDALHLILNMEDQALDFELPPSAEGWMRLIDTSRPSPDDIQEPSDAPPVTGASYWVEGRSVVLLQAGSLPT